MINTMILEAGKMTGLEGQGTLSVCPKNQIYGCEGASVWEPKLYLLRISLVSGSSEERTHCELAVTVYVPRTTG